MKVYLEIDLVGHFCNDWPLLEVLHDDRTIFDGQVESDQTLDFDLDCTEPKSILLFRHKGKRFGDDGIWDTDLPDRDRYIDIRDIRFDGVSIGEEIRSKLWFDTQWNDTQKQSLQQGFIETYTRFLCHGIMNFNGVILLPFDLPVYNWLILTKYKTDTVANLSYFSQYQENWHYEPDIQLIKEIKALVNFD